MCSEGAAITLANGNILFGTLNGYYTVDRRKLVTDNASMMKLRITDFFLNGELVSTRLNGYYNYYIPEAKQVNIPRHNDVFTFRFAAMNYQLQHRMHYQYMLEGYDKEWRNADKTRTASYSGVPTGNYRFKVKAFLLDSPDKYDMRTIEVIIPPHPLYSGNAILFYIVLAITITLILLFWQKKRQVKKQNLKVIKLGPQEMAFVHKEDYDFVKSQLNWLEANYSNPELKIEDLVDQSKHNRTDYYKQMKELTGQTPKDFVNDFRIKKAVMFLENTNDTIAEIATKTGFNDPLLFTRLFMQKIGVTPSKYREQKNLEREGHETIHET